MDDRTLAIYTVRDAETVLGRTISEDEFLSIKKWVADGFADSFVELMEAWQQFGNHSLY